MDDFVNQRVNEKISSYFINIHFPISRCSAYAVQSLHATSRNGQKLFERNSSETEPGEKFENVPTVIMVYISEFDLLKGGRTAYHVEKVVKETGEIIDDGLKEIFVNTKVDDGTDLGELLQLFNQTNVDSPKFPAFSKRMNYLKHDEGGKQRMCTIMEEYAKEYAEEYAKEYVDAARRKDIANAIENNVEPQLITKIFNIPLEVVLKMTDEVLDKKS